MGPKTQNVNEVEEKKLYELNRARVEPPQRRSWLGGDSKYSNGNFED